MKSEGPSDFTGGYRSFQQVGRTLSATYGKMAAHKILDKLNEVFTQFEFPERLISDNALYFTAKSFCDTGSTLRIKQCKTMPYHHSLNITELLNWNIKPMLVSYAKRHKDWDAYPCQIMLALRTTVNWLLFSHQPFSLLGGG